MFGSLVVGFILSFIGSMPIAGPIAVLVLSKGLEHRHRAGFFIAIGAAVAEAIYAFLAFWGFSKVLARFPIVLPASRLVGCVLLIALGIYMMVRKPSPPEHVEHRDRSNAVGARNILVGFSMTAVNPTLIVTWTAAVSASNASGLIELTPNRAIPFAIGVCTGIILWFASMLSVLKKFKNKMRYDRMNRVIRVMGFVLLLSGTIFGVRALIQWR